MRNEENDRSGNQVLADLIRARLDELRWTSKEAAAHAKNIGLGKGFSAGAIDYVLRGNAKREYKEDKIRKIARVLGGVEDEWVRLSGRTTNRSLLIERGEIIKIQSVLNKGDIVTIVASRSLLEASDQDVTQMVLQNLDRGVIYRYFLPISPNPYDDEATNSYFNFLSKNVFNHGFSDTPRIFGFEVESNKFGFFSRLHTIIRIETKASKSSSNTYVYVELGSRDSTASKGVWYLLPPDLDGRLSVELFGLKFSFSIGTSSSHALNPKLRSIATQYRKWFSNPDSVEKYQNLRRTLDHAGMRFYEGILAEVGRQVADGAFYYLDIGCGDGTITRTIADHVKDYHPMVVAIDPSESQIVAAQKTFSDFAEAKKQVEFETIEFERFKSDRRFSLITAIHSFYVIDESYLQKVYNLLADGGVAYIWMAGQEGNVMTALCNAFDKAIRPGQRRNTADALADYALSAGLRVQVTAYEGLLHLQENSIRAKSNEARDLVEFCALRPAYDYNDIWEIAQDVFAELRSDDEAPVFKLTDKLLRIARNR